MELQDLEPPWLGGFDGVDLRGCEYNLPCTPVFLIFRGFSGFRISSMFFGPSSRGFSPISKDFVTFQRSETKNTDAHGTLHVQKRLSGFWFHATDVPCGAAKPVGSKGRSATARL